LVILRLLSSGVLWLGVRGGSGSENRLSTGPSELGWAGGLEHPAEAAEELGCWEAEEPRVARGCQGAHGLRIWTGWGSFGS